MHATLDRMLPLDDETMTAGVIAARATATAHPTQPSRHHPSSQTHAIARRALNLQMLL